MVGSSHSYMGRCVMKVMDETMKDRLRPNYLVFVGQSRKNIGPREGLQEDCVM